ncbi:CoA transferase [Pseudonocardia dioxanivorans]|nr:CoA transferase [Pseudonocardia dioxanivorans]
MEAQHQQSEAPLSEVRVLEMGQILAAPYCGRLLADAGADVVKIESPHGDPSRGLPAILSDEHSGYFMWLNVGKKSVVADLRNDDDLALVRGLALKADADREHVARNPGQEGPELRGPASGQPGPGGVFGLGVGATGVYADRAGQGIVAEGWAGAIDMNGAPDQPPVPLGIALADVSAGLHAYSAILTASTSGTAPTARATTSTSRCSMHPALPRDHLAGGRVR